MKKILLIFSVCTILGSCILNACNRQEPTGEIISGKMQTKEEKEEDPFIEGNKKIMGLENEEIELFIARYGWQTQKTGTGLQVEITKNGKGNFFKEGDKVRLNYTTILLTGEKIYDSANDGEKVFVVDKTEEIPALHEVVKMLKPGGQARMVIPSYLAYGVGGDGNKIVGRASIAMGIEVDMDTTTRKIKNI